MTAVHTSLCDAGPVRLPCILTYIPQHLGYKDPVSLIPKKKIQEHTFQKTVIE